MPSLALKASINYPFIGGPSGPVYPWVDPDGQDWLSSLTPFEGQPMWANPIVEAEEPNH